jgi:hypothetical protein
MSLAPTANKGEPIMKELFIEELVLILGGAATIDAREPPNLAHDVLGSQPHGSSGPGGANMIKENVGGPLVDPAILGPNGGSSGPGGNRMIQEGHVRGF